MYGVWGEVGGRVYRVIMKDGEQVDLIAKDYDHMLKVLVERGITPNHILKIWTDVPIHMKLYNEAKKEIQREKGR